MTPSRMMIALPLAAVLLTGCEEIDDPSFEFGSVLADLELELISDTVGVHPDNSVIFDTNNPFRQGVTIEGKFAVLDDGPIPGFYAFATALVGEPTGENQWFSANQMQLIHERRLADPNDLALVRKIAIQGYQTVLDEFPGAVTFDATGRLRFDLMASAVQGIIDLGGEPENGWTLATDADGNPIAVQSGAPE